MRLGDLDALKEEMRNWLALPNRDNDARDVVLHLIAVIDNAPTVEQIDDTELQRAIGYAEGYSKGRNERPQGEWIFRQGVTCGGYYKCSKCGEVERAEKNFCSNCGAKMQKGGADMRGDNDG